jgi:23S rRNA pseudouridine2605 synthase
VDGRRIDRRTETAHHYVLLNKPVGVVSTAYDPEGRRTVLDLVNVPARIYPVGRLDLDSEGLVLLTDDGDLTYHLTQARNEVEKEYEALVPSGVVEHDMRVLRRGVLLEDGQARAVRAGVIAETPDGTWVRVVLHEGRNREVRRMLQALGYVVLRLRRVRLGTLTLGQLPLGRWRHLRPEEVNRLRTVAGLDRNTGKRRRVD